MTAERTRAGNQPNLIRWIMLAVLAWGLFLALGAYLFGGNLPALRAVIIAATVAAFLGFWISALALRQRRIEHHPTGGDDQAR